MSEVEKEKIEIEEVSCSGASTGSGSGGSSGGISPSREPQQTASGDTSASCTGSDTSASCTGSENSGRSSNSPKNRNPQGTPQGQSDESGGSGQNSDRSSNSPPKESTPPGHSDESSGRKADSGRSAMSQTAGSGGGQTGVSESSSSTVQRTSEGKMYGHGVKLSLPPKKRSEPFEIRKMSLSGTVRFIICFVTSFFFKISWFKIMRASSLAKKERRGPSRSNSSEEQQRKIWEPWSFDWIQIVT